MHLAKMIEAFFDLMSPTNQIATHVMHDIALASPFRALIHVY